MRGQNEIEKNGDGRGFEEKDKDEKSLQLLEAVSGNAGVVHRDDRLSETNHGREALQTNVYLI